MTVAGAHQVCVRGVPRVVRAIDTVNDQLSVDLLATDGTRNTTQRLVPPAVCGSWPLHTVGPAVFLGSPPTRNALLVPPAVCGSVAAPHSMGPAVFRGLTANQQRTLGPSWSLRLMAAPHSGTRGFPGPTADPQRTLGSLLESAASGRSSQCGTRGFPGPTADPQRTLGPSWSLRLSGRSSQWNPWFSWAHR